MTSPLTEPTARHLETPRSAFAALWDGRKTCDLAPDVIWSPGDVAVYHEYGPDGPTGRELPRVVTDVERGGPVPAGYVLLSFGQGRRATPAGTGGTEG